MSEQDHAQATVELLFATRLYRARPPELLALIDELAACCRSASEDDTAGRAWSVKHGYSGYTSYASLADLPWRFPAMEALVGILDRHAAAFAQTLAWDLGDRRLQLDSLWINALDPGGAHGAHIHPNSVISGTVYVAVPPGAGAIRFEDPRLARMMAAPPRRQGVGRELQSFVSIEPQPGLVLLWESWLRHEVSVNRARKPRLSISFNFAWR